MVKRRLFIGVVRRAGYTYKTRKKRVEMYRQKGGTHRLLVPLTDLLDDRYVASTMRQMGYSPEEIEEFLRDHSDAP